MTTCKDSTQDPSGFTKTILRRSGVLFCRAATLAMVGLMLTSVNAYGAPFWVVGSYVKEHNARVEGVRLSNATGIEIFMLPSVLSGQVYHRLVTGYLESQAARNSLKAQLLSAGAPEPWKLVFEGPTPFLEPLLEDFSGQGKSETANVTPQMGRQVVSADGEEALDAALFAEISDAELLEIDQLLATFGDDMTDESNHVPGNDPRGESAQRIATSALSGTGQRKIGEAAPRHWPGENSSYNAARLNKTSDWPSRRPIR